MKVANEVFRFLVELAAVASLGLGAWQLGDGPGRVALAVTAVLAGVVVWGVLVAPKSARRLADPARLLVEVAFFVVAAVALASATSVVWGVVLAVVAIANAVSLRFHEPVLGALGPHPQTTHADPEADAPG